MAITESEVGARLDRLPIWPHPKSLLFMLGAGFFFAYFEGVNIGIALPGALDQFNASLGDGARVVSLGLWGTLLGTLSSGYLSDRKGRRAALFSGVLLCGAGSLVSAFAPSLTVFTGARFLANMGAAAASITIGSYLSELSPAARRGRHVATAVIPGMAGLASVPFIGLAVVPAFDAGWRVMLAIPALAAVIYLAGYRMMPESPRWLVTHGRADEAEKVLRKAEDHVRSRISGELPPVDTRQTARPGTVLDAKETGQTWKLFQPPNLRWTVLFALIWFGFQVPVKSVLGLGVELLTRRGFDIAQSIALSIGLSVGVVIGALLAFAVTDMFPRKHSLAAMTAASAVLIILMGIFPTTALIVVAWVAMGMVIGFSTPILNLITAEHFPTRIRNRGASVSSALGDLGGVAGPYIAVAAFTAVGFSGAWFAFGGFLLVLLIPLAMTRNTNGTALESVTTDLPADVPAGSEAGTATRTPA
ncbi:MFS transporter [Streptomyces sp. VNUA24]|uniref:MFS transporter n=1 Tax=Streptomyces sp. VNUA24 TaxID=3031131 RepID=UPI0023B7FEA7|nr:MFS transporter [Streptomyces sp. VNUA24]WEH12948.1 MFS transporter [Streptomyces sp. VNUA24]